MRAVNLLPRDEQRARFEGARTPLLVLAGGLAAVTSAIAVLTVSAAGTVDDRKAELAAIEVSIARLPRPQPTVVSQGALAQERADRVAALSAALSSRVSFDRVLREISLVLPEDAWLTGFKAAAPSAVPVVTTPGAPPPAASASSTEGVTIQGATYSHDSVARLLSRLSVVPSLEGVRLTASAVLDPEQEEGADAKAARKLTKKQRIVTFTITAALRTGASS